MGTLAVMAALAACERPAPKSPPVIVADPVAPVEDEVVETQQPTVKPPEPTDLGPVPVTRDDPSYGDRLAPVTVVVFSDLQCRWCAHLHATLKEAHKRYPRDLRIVFKHYPLPIHPQARRAAEIATAVRVVHGDQACWTYLDKAFEMLTDRGATAEQVLSVLKLDNEPRILTVSTSSGVQRKVDADLRLGQELRVAGTPKSYINGRVIDGAVPPAALDERIASSLTEARAAIARGVRGEALYVELTKQNFESPSDSE
jgi:protein-disulfide isomerase